MDVSQYLEIFIDETKEHLQNLNEQILILEKEPDNTETINEIFRAAHSLKGMAGTMGYKRMQRLTHDMENVFSNIRDGKMTVEDDLIDVLFRGLDALENYLETIQTTADEGTEDNEDIIKALNDILEGGGKASAPQETNAVAAVQKEVSKTTETAFENLRIADFEKNAIDKAKNEGQNVFALNVAIQESCILKAARAFLVFKALEEYGDVIKSVPEVQDIEDEKFDMDFTVLLVTDADAEKIKSAVMTVSEIEKADIKEFEVKADMLEKEENTAKEKEEAKETAKKQEEKKEEKNNLQQHSRQRRVHRENKEENL